MSVGGDQAKEMRDFLSRTIGKCFSGLSTPRKARLISAHLRQLPYEPLENQVESVLQNTGPTVQKLLQPISDEVTDPVIDRAAARIIDQAVENPSHKKLVGAASQSVRREFDFRLEGANMETAKNYENKGIAVGRVHEGFKAQRRAMVQKLAPGKPLADVPLSERDVPIKRLKQMSSEEMKKTREAMEKLAGAWFERAIFEDGFFQGDMHAGNVFIDLPEDVKKALLTIIDFGNAETLTLAQRQGFIELSLSQSLGASGNKWISQSLGKVMGITDPVTLQKLHLALEKSNWSGSISSLFQNRKQTPGC